MATFFGEVREVSSRAYDEDEEDDDNVVVSYKVKEELNKEGLEKIPNVKAVIISHGKLATDFCEALVLSEKCINVGTLGVEVQGQTDCEDTGDFHPRHPTPSQLFMSPQSLLVCCVSKDVKAVVASQFAQVLLGLLKSSCMVMVLSSHHYGALKGSYEPQGEDNCVVHSLHSPAFSDSPVYPRLPQPATIDSVPAAVLTECVVGSRPCVLYSVYTETYSTGDLDLVVDALIKVFQTGPFKKFMPASLKQNKLHQYRAKNPQNETLDRYM
ncbi:proteasome assembly chaperone 1-like [Homarus americanus]|uniref:Proteasome assembly chaperone 1 n=1 Tax=Homarus americanus TaxID=6706 RepID=A0A8J5JQX5_HOMAM|nr:proteasome assembly chaperone 1-like [Homarus americanus]KAG7159524.1 Proteasome assembly chaperone 1-like [Homarus americanus]